MSIDPRRVGKGAVAGASGYRAIVAGYVEGGAPHVEMRILARGLGERWIRFSAPQAREAVRLLQQALQAAEIESRDDGHSVTSGARTAPAEGRNDGSDINA